MSSDALMRAIRDTAPARARLERVYGRNPPVIACLQWPGGPVQIVRCLRLVGTVHRLYTGSDGTIAVRAVVPGGQALEHWFRRRHREPREADNVVADARRFGDVQAIDFIVHGDMRRATVLALRKLDPFLADFERLYLNGAGYPELAALTGMTRSQVQDTIDRMRSLGFEMPHRRIYVRKGA